LRISPGATLLGSTDVKDFGPRHLIYAEGAEFVAVDGGGLIDGQGSAFWTEQFRPMENRPSPYLEFVRCRQVRVENIHIRQTPGWGIRPRECDGVLIRGISLISDLRGPNTDGIDPESSRNVIISDVHIETGDDAICPKTRDGKPLENLVVTNSVLRSDDSAFKLGTASNGAFRNIAVSNCAIFGSKYGLAMYIKDGALVEGVSFANIQIETEGRANYPILIDLEKRTETSPEGRIRDVTFSDIRIKGDGRVLVSGMPGRPLENFLFRNLTMRVTGYPGVNGLRKPRGVRDMPPAPPELDHADIPASMIFAHARGLRLRDIRILSDAAPADRNSLWLSRVEGLDIQGLEAPLNARHAIVGLDRVKTAPLPPAWTRGAVHQRKP
jgi:hypothetical protein